MLLLGHLLIFIENVEYNRLTVNFPRRSRGFQHTLAYIKLSILQFETDVIHHDKPLLEGKIVSGMG